MKLERVTITGGGQFDVDTGFGGDFEAVAICGVGDIGIEEF
jgi:hypothetical protein